MLNQPSSFSIGEIYDEFFLVLVEIGAAKFCNSCKLGVFSFEVPDHYTVEKKNHSLKVTLNEDK